MDYVLDCPCLIDKGEKSDDPTVDRLLERVRDVGWGIFHSRGRPVWALTVGLWHSFRYPDLLVCGQDRFGRTSILVQARVALSTGPLQVDQVARAVADPFVMVVRVDESWHRTELMRIPFAFYGGEVPEYQQLICADALGFFPDEKGHAGTRGGDQPNLALRWDDHPAGVWRDLNRRA